MLQNKRLVLSDTPKHTRQRNTIHRSHKHCCSPRNVDDPLRSQCTSHRNLSDPSDKHTPPQGKLSHPYTRLRSFRNVCCPFDMRHTHRCTRIVRSDRRSHRFLQRTNAPQHRHCYTPHNERAAPSYPHKSQHNRSNHSDKHTLPRHTSFRPNKPHRNHRNDCRRFVG